MNDIEKDEIFSEQLRIFECCAQVTENNVIMSYKYFTEMIVRGIYKYDKDEKYELLSDMLERKLTRKDKNI